MYVCNESYTLSHATVTITCNTHAWLLSKCVKYRNNHITISVLNMGTISVCYQAVRVWFDISSKWVVWWIFFSRDCALIRSLDRPLPYNSSPTFLFGTIFDVVFINWEIIEDMPGNTVCFKSHLKVYQCLSFIYFFEF